MERLSVLADTGQEPGMMQERGVLRMHVLLDVPYQEKDLAKKRGARWNPQLKSWYVDDLTKVGAVSEWIGNDNIVCENLYILTKEHTCWKCGKILMLCCWQLTTAVRWMTVINAIKICKY